MATTVVALAITSASAFAQDDDKDLNVGGLLKQTVDTGGKIDLQSDGFGNFQGINLIRSEGNINATDGTIEQTVTLGGVLNLKQDNIASRQAANYLGARGKLDAGQITQSVTGATEVVLSQVGSHLSVQGVNVIEAGSSILPAEELGNVAEAVTNAVVEVATGKLRAAAGKLFSR